MAEVQAVCAKWELDADADRPGDRRRALPRRARWVTVAAIPGQRLVDDCAGLPPRGARVGEAAQAAAPPRPPRTPADLEDRAPAAARRARPSRASAGCSSSTTPPCRRTPRCGPGGDAGVFQVPGTVRHRRHRRLQLALGGARSLRRRQGDRRRGRAQPRLHRGRAPRHHRLPQLRQPRKARGVLPVPRGLPRHHRRVPARSARRSPAATSRSTTRARPARSIRRRRWAWSGCCASRSTGGRSQFLPQHGRCHRHLGAHPRAPGRLGATGPRCSSSSAAAPPPVDLQAERRCSSSWSRRPGRAAPLGPRLQRRGTRGGAGGVLRSAGRMPRARIGATLDLTAYARRSRPEGCCSVRTGPRRRSLLPHRCRSRSSSSPRNMVCLLVAGRVTVGERRGSCDPRPGGSLAMGRATISGAIYIDAIPRRMAARRDRHAAGGPVIHVRHRRRLGNS